MATGVSFRLTPHLCDSVQAARIVSFRRGLASYFFHNPLWELALLERGYVKIKVGGSGLRLWVCGHSFFRLFCGKCAVETVKFARASGAREVLLESASRFSLILAPPAKIFIFF